MDEDEKKFDKLVAYPPVTAEQRIIWEIFFLFVIIITVAIFGQFAGTNVIYTIIITVIFLINLTIRFILVNEKGDWIFFVLGILAGGGNDLMSMINGVYSYTSVTILPFLNGLLPLWMILFWGQIFLIFRKIFHLKWFKGEEFQKDGPYLRGWVDNRFIADIIVLICLRIVIYNTFMDLWLPIVIYAAIIGVRLLIFRPRKNELFIMATLPYAWLFEGLMVVFGLYIYIHPIFLGQPGWLYLWWLFLVPLLFKEVFDRLEYLIKDKQ